VNSIDAVGGSEIGFGAPEIATAGRDGKKTREIPLFCLKIKILSYQYRLRESLGSKTKSSCFIP